MTPLVEELVPAPDPARCCEQLSGLPYRLFLDSASRDARLGRYSFVCADPVAVVRSKNTIVEQLGADGSRHRIETDALSAVRAWLAPHHADPVPDLPAFQGGAAGYIGYDFGLTLERLPAPRYDDLALDDLVVGIYDWVIAWDHDASRAWLISTGVPQTDPAAKEQRARQRALEVRRWLDVGRALSGSPGEPDPGSPTRQARSGGVVRPTTGNPVDVAPSFPVEGGWWDERLQIRSSFTRSEYLKAVQRVRDYIYAGDIFQTNLSQRFEAPLTESPWAFYLRLRTRNAAPFAAYMDLPDATILSASPERFLRIDAAGQVETRPIKGTSPRGLGPEHDAALGHALTESEKDRAENLMIVDLMRNDLSRVCEPGTVRVPELFALERYATVHHLVSTVVGQLSPGTDALDVIRAAFPGGSITGAPKVRAMEIIAELEPSRRGVYCGSMGYWSVSGNMDTSIGIRTAVVSGGRVYFSAGGGIIADSVPAQEYRETLDKARGIIDALTLPV
jgi:para-aminobenzoate synthetase component 1